MNKKQYFEDLEIIDLEEEELPARRKAPASKAEAQTNDLSKNNTDMEEAADAPEATDEADTENPEEETFLEEDNEEPVSGSWRDKITPQVIFHISTLVVVLFVVFFIFHRFSNFGTHVDQSEIFKDGLGKYEDDMDLMLPVDESFLEGRVDDGVTTIVTFGNAPFADDRDSENNLANMIAEEADAVVYNCSIPGSYLASQEDHFIADKAPMDAYTFYWLACLACDLGVDKVYADAKAALGDDAPEGIDEIINTISTIDFNQVDVIAIMYDATDYFMGNYIYDISYHQNIQAFTGNLVAGLTVLQETYPHIRIIVMSPTYAFYVDEEGNYLSSDQYKYNPDEDVLSTYCIYQSDMCSERSVSFIDNLYGSITEDNAEEYLKDHLHLNQAGRELIKDRFLEALYYFD